MFFNMGFYRVTIKGIRATEQEAPILALAPHSSFTDAFPVVLLTAPSLVVKSSVKNIPFFHSKYDRVLSSSHLFLLSFFKCHKAMDLSLLFSILSCSSLPCFISVDGFYLGYCLIPLFHFIQSVGCFHFYSLHLTFS